MIINWPRPQRGPDRPDPDPCEEPAWQKASKAKIAPSEDSCCRICNPIARLWGKKTVKNGPLRALCSRRFFCRAGS